MNKNSNLYKEETEVCPLCKATMLVRKWICDHDYRTVVETAKDCVCGYYWNKAYGAPVEEGKGGFVMNKNIIKQKAKEIIENRKASETSIVEKAAVVVEVAKLDTVRITKDLTGASKKLLVKTGQKLIEMGQKEKQPKEEVCYAYRTVTGWVSQCGGYSEVIGDRKFCPDCGKKSKNLRK